MLRFIKHHMTSIDGIEIYPIISLLIFVAFFIGLTWYVVKMKKSDIKEMSNIPLEEDK
ncbi:MAG: CcoQ/FixQ family Cbb3-type cytochrome c oxidase assembly chaperone [Crocinitomicaceae bacterium]|nr:CcoQ/FixQ family Cbb3-type cytochrome c oxidase assembly chaperone [Crocinitomicaceae bacterium]